MSDPHATQDRAAGTACFSGTSSWCYGKGYTEIRAGWYIQVPGGVSWIYYSPFQAELRR